MTKAGVKTATVKVLDALNDLYFALAKLQSEEILSEEDFSRVQADMRALRALDSQIRSWYEVS